ncbi:DEAD/DEAH box helicase [uncultured Massilia sp.]|uniref:DEAD/DEAH box helicase n=1 Tax=uncultured Massilia sp. TaxID=169973 RepID=UPI0025F12147|nr:DEAD/DEAH box helicase [uncultured Massilia sp.]
MNKKLDWAHVWTRLRELASHPDLWRADQDRSLAWIATQLETLPGVLVADEVGLGKTRLAIALAVCVIASGGRVAILIPPGLTYQWRDEELDGFWKQITKLGLAWIPKDIKTKVLRTYPDLFANGAHASTYPLSSHARLLFISHRFGLPQRLTSTTNDELWGLPFALKRKLVKSGKQAYGAGKLVLSDGQSTAVDWLATNMPATLRERVTNGALTKVSTATFDDPEAQQLFRNLVGELVGDVDLMIIDEAHKSRAGTDMQTRGDKQAAAHLRSRLTHCIDDIILRPGSASRKAKRLALTATPMEIDAQQWITIFQRLGFKSADIAPLKKTVQEFADAVKALRIGSADELTRLSAAGATFQQALRPIVTRRVWRDHKMVKEFSAHAARPDVAHPHRQTVATTIALDSLYPSERTQLAYAEALAAASRGIETTNATRTAGSRHAQALPLISEQVVGEMPVAPPTADRDAAERAKRQRQAYWLQALADQSRALGRVAEQPQWSLQWHPKVRHAIELIEGLVTQDKKVLVFAEFLAPMWALDRALNIRHYLREVQAGKPVPLPTKIKADDPDLLRWLADSSFGFTPSAIASFEENANILARRYTNERAALRDACQHAVTVFFEQQHERAKISSKSIETLVTWLVQQLSVDDQLVSVATSRRERIQDSVDNLLRTLRDADPAGQTDADEVRAGRRFDWEAVIRDQEEDLEKDQHGHYVFRMSPFSQRLYGDIKPSTRRVRQSAFNNAKLNPKVLIGQSDVASEGLNLHRACRAVVLFHLDWNPGRIEQQIGRVDRQDSAWMQAFEAWRDRDGARGDAPYIDVHTIALEGTYDAFRTEVVNERTKVLRSQLFGEILPAEQLQRLPLEAQAAIGHIHIDFRP